MTPPFRQDSSIKDLGGSDISDNELSNSLDILPDMGYGKIRFIFSFICKTCSIPSALEIGCGVFWYYCYLVRS